MRHSEILTTLQNLTTHKPTQQEIANILGVSINTIGARAVRDSNYSIEEIKKIGDKLGVNLFTKKNQKCWSELKGQNHFDVLESMLEAEMTYGVEKTLESLFIADYYPEVFGSCGTGTFVPADYRESISVPKQCVNAYNANKKYSVIHAYGDSMQPYIHDKDLLVFEDYNGEQICDNRIYVFRYEDKIFIKRLVLNINQLIIKSDNAEYKPITVDLKDADIQIIGKFAGLMRKAE